MCDIERDGRPKFEQAASAGHDKSSTARPDSGVRDPGLGTSGRSWARREPARAGDSGAGDSCPCEVSGLFRHFPSGFPEHAMVLQRELCAISTARRVAGNSRVFRIRIGILREGEPDRRGGGDGGWRQDRTRVVSAAACLAALGTAAAHSARLCGPDTSACSGQISGGVNRRAAAPSCWHVETPACCA